MKDLATQDSQAYFLEMLRRTAKGLLAKGIYYRGWDYGAQVRSILFLASGYNCIQLLSASSSTTTHNFLNHKVRESPGSFLLLSAHSNKDIMRFSCRFPCGYIT